jgi:hypothetical protein
VYVHFPAGPLLARPVRLVQIERLRAADGD